MEKSLNEILKEVGKEYEMEDEIINSIIKKLQKEFYVKLKHMKNLSIETWKSLELPINLYYVLNELYQSALNEQQSTQTQPMPLPQPVQNNKNVINEEKPQIVPSKIQPQTQPPKQNLNNSNYQKNNNLLNNIVNMINDQNSLSNIIHNDLSILFSEIDNLDISRQVFKQLYTIINNIAHNPNEEKYRRFNITKFMSKFNYKTIKDFFIHIGFKIENE